MDKNVIIEIMVLLAMVLVGMFVFKKKGKGFLKYTLSAIVENFMIKAENYLGSKAGEKKLEMVLNLYEAKLAILPPVSRFLFKLFLPKKKLKKLIMELIPHINEMFKPLYELNKNSLNQFAKNVKDQIVNEALLSEVNGDVNLTSNMQLSNLSNSFDNKIEKNGIVGTYAKIETDFKDSTNFEAGLQAMYRF